MAGISNGMGVSRGPQREPPSGLNYARRIPRRTPTGNQDFPPKGLPGLRKRLFSVLEQRQQFVPGDVPGHQALLPAAAQGLHLQLQTCR